MLRSGHVTHREIHLKKKHLLRYRLLIFRCKLPHCCHFDQVRHGVGQEIVFGLVQGRTGERVVKSTYEGQWADDVDQKIKKENFRALHEMRILFRIRLEIFDVVGYVAYFLFLFKFGANFGFRV